jgi:hypothetical protein
LKKKGRPASATTLASRYTAAQVLDRVHAENMWLRYLNSEDERISLDAWKYLNDRVHGKPAQAVDMTTKGESIAQVIVNL